MKSTTFLSSGLLFIMYSLTACHSADYFITGATVPPVPLGKYHASATPCDPRATSEADAQLAYLAALSNGTKEGVLVGQNMGHGSQILDRTGFAGYEPLVGTLGRQTGELPAIVGLDYEHDQIFTATELSSANAVLIAHAAKKGMITINWAPHSPWLNDESDLAKNHGTWVDTRTINKDMSAVDLRLLLDPASPYSVIWRKKLDRIANALQELQNAHVVVLWRPLQEMDGDWFWWGTRSAKYDPSLYIGLWRDMYHYFTETKGLHNLLWVFSPTMQKTGSMDKLYPGAEYVDIVAPTAYQDDLIIGDVAFLQHYNKVLGMGEYGSQSWRGWNDSSGTYSLRGTFDDTLYVRRLVNTYPSIAYWVCWHNWSNGDGTSEHQALVSNENASALMNDARVITLSRLSW